MVQAFFGFGPFRLPSTDPPTPATYPHTSPHFTPPPTPPKILLTSCSEGNDYTTDDGAAIRCDS